MRKVTQVLRGTREKREHPEPKETQELKVIPDHQGHPVQRATQVRRETQEKRGIPDQKETQETSQIYQR